MHHLPYNKDLKTFSRELRNNSTQSEIILWKQLRAGGMMGYQFNRQKPLDNYIVDFYCKPLNMVIEIDGGYHTHPEQIVADKERQKILEDLQLNFLRFTDMEVRTKMANVLGIIENYILKYQEKHPAVNAKKRVSDK